MAFLIPFAPLIASVIGGGVAIHGAVQASKARKKGRADTAAAIEAQKLSDKEAANAVRSGADIDRVKAQRKKRAQGAQGARSTIKTSPLGIPGLTASRKSLLGR